MTTGHVLAIYTAPEAGAPMVPRDAVDAIAGTGLAGDRYAARRGSYSGQRVPDADRAITLIEREALEAVWSEHGVELAAHETRRNVLTQGVALNDLVGCAFRVGEVELRGIGLAVPCAYLESLTRDGVLRALVDRGGLRAAIVAGGTLRVGDAIEPLNRSECAARR